MTGTSEGRPSSDNILQGLNPAQREAVETVDGPLLIVAGPGSGKTRVITHRIAYLLSVRGISPYRIMAVTFTNKAAREMKDRLERLVGFQANQLSVSTFHSFCAQVLRREGHHIGLDPGFTIYDDEDQGAVLKQAMEQAGLDIRQYPRRAVQGVISRAKSLLMDPRSLAMSQQSYFEERASRAYEKYEALLDRNSAVDFDDLLMKVVVLFRQNSDVLGGYQHRFLYVMIDEFQDTNTAQYALSKMVAGEYRNICVVGDPDQSIYSWRNADIRNILSFQQDYPEAATINLEENYRSTGNILEAARGLIANNRLRLDKDLRTEKEAGPPIVVHEAYTEAEEAKFVVSEVSRLKKEDGIPPRDCAVAYRVNAQSRAMEEECLKQGMPYRLVGGVRFYQRREVKDLMCYLRLVANPHDSVSLARVINVPPRGIGQRSMGDLQHWAQSQDIPLFTAIERVAEGQATHPLSPRATASVKGFYRLIHELAEASRSVDAVDLLDGLLERISYHQYLVEGVEHPEERWENIMELRAVAQEFTELDPPEGLHQLLERFALVSDVDQYDQNADGLTLITLHQIKGLEFPVMFLIGMEEGLLPHFRSIDDEAEMEEERRLCYVGITRAKEKAYLVRSFRRGFRGMTGPTIPSRFLSEIPQDLVQPAVKVRQPARSSWGPWAPAAPQNDQEVAPALGLKAGDRVRHTKFGDGMVISCVPVDGGDQQVTVAFEADVGVKRLLLSFAPLEKL